MVRWLVFAALVAAVGCAASPASAASFNCAFAGLPTEYAICQVPALSRADEAMAEQYFWLIDQAPPDVDAALRAEQRDWLGERNTCGYDARCILRSYNARLDRLREWRDEFENARQDGDRYDGEQRQGALHDGPYDGGEYDSFGPDSDPRDEIVPFEDPGYGD